MISNFPKIPKKNLYTRYCIIWKKETQLDAEPAISILLYRPCPACCVYCLKVAKQPDFYFFVIVVKKVRSKHTAWTGHHTYKLKKR